jgi:hypothetical protein
MGAASRSAASNGHRRPISQSGRRLTVSDSGTEGSSTLGAVTKASRWLWPVTAMASTPPWLAQQHPSGG